MAHQTRDAEQNAKFKTLLQAVDGNGEAVEAVVQPFIPDNIFLESGLTQAVPATTTATSFEELFTEDITVAGGLYKVDLVAFYEMENPTSQDRVELQVLLDDVGPPTIGEVIGKTAGAAGDDDDFEHFTFNQVVLTPGVHTVSIEGLVDDQQAPGIVLHLTRFRVYATKVGTG